MIKDAVFFIKMLGLTVLVALILQARVGQQTIEDHFDGWVKTSVIVDSIQEAIDGGILLVNAGYKKADSGLRYFFARMTKRHEGPKERGINVDLKRYNESEESMLEGELPARLPAANSNVSSP
ncbi:MAG: hypothetical protein IT289_09855 [Oligoflexia bacterium]|nr:hypothetical protein [Oligoflexia bacterium]